MFYKTKFIFNFLFLDIYKLFFLKKLVGFNMAVKVRDYIFLQASLFVYAICALCEKFTSKLPVMSTKFILGYVFVVALLGVYAILWQQILKRIDLNIAFSNKAVTVIWGFVLGCLVLGETISLKMVVGAILVITGIILLMVNDK